ncbi:MAG TPA: hypothetical protein VFA98_06580 [Thermoanaerobaculia bacterium]|nr:hypothetical protein [Thermoanaerobaculia bacterium]
MSMTLWSKRRGAWIHCPGPGCEEALAEFDEETGAMDRRPLPRGDWSGNPETWGRPHSHLGGDLSPFHPWLDFPIAERAKRWAMGDRPENHEHEGEGARRARMARSEVSARMQLEHAARSAARDLVGKNEIVAVDVGMTAGYAPGVPGNHAVVVYVDGVFGDVEGVRCWLSQIDWERVYGWPVFDVRPMTVPLVDCVRRGEAFMVGAFFYDPDLAKFGNAFSPFVDLPYERAQRAMQLPLSDRYGSRLDAPGWSDYMAMGDPGPTCWTDPETGVISMFPAAEAARRAASGQWV